MPSQLNAYLNFRGNAREAMEFYRTVFGGKLEMNTYSEFHASEDPSEANNIMHSTLTAENGMTLMGSDTPQGMDHQVGTNVSLSLSGDNETELRGYWERLSPGSTLGVPLEMAPWGDTFGMLTDKFGIHWMVNIAGPKA